MAQKSRSLKTPIQLWVADTRKANKETSADLARLTKVSVDTARGWESRGRPNEDAIRILETHWGEPAPVAGATGDTPVAPALLAALAAQTVAISELVGELRSSRQERDATEVRLRALEAELGLLRERPGAEGSRELDAPRTTGR